MGNDDPLEKRYPEQHGANSKHKQNQKNHENDFGDASRRAGDARESKGTRDDGDEREKQDEFDHGVALYRLVSDAREHLLAQEANRDNACVGMQTR